ncbi:MAG: hypothetical protein FWF57_08655 [Defluviitaleaceae bacterium]|nr:hypothetical protein [Defluviitaleaceae bacterium]
MFTLIISSILTSIGTSLRGLDAWFVDSIREIDGNYNFESFFSKISILFTFLNMIFVFLGAQILANLNLSLPIIISSILKPFILLVMISFLGSSFLTTLPSYYWQILFLSEDGNIISGYISVILSILSVTVVYYLPKMKFDNNKRIKALIINAVISPIFLILSVIFQNFYISLLFFIIHVVFSAVESFIIGIYIIDLFNKDNRRTLGAFYETLQTIIVMLVLLTNTILIERVSMGISWIIMSIMSVVFTVPLLIMVLKRQNEFWNEKS